MAKTGPANNWYVITGAPSAGKSTVIKHLAGLGYTTFPEVGRFLIDQDLAAGKTLEAINVGSPEFEQRFVDLQQAREAKLNKHDLIFFDRGILDALAFYRHCGWPVPAATQRLCDQASYNQTVFLLELDGYQDDYARVETAETVRGLQKLSGKVYEELGYEIINIPRTSVEKRVDLILTTIKEKHHGLVT